MITQRRSVIRELRANSRLRGAWVLGVAQFSMATCSVVGDRPPPVCGTAVTPDVDAWAFGPPWQLVRSLLRSGGPGLGTPDGGIPRPATE
jgi:hypothetical protein